jgi:hypothetical protein
MKFMNIAILAVSALFGLSAKASGLCDGNQYLIYNCKGLKLPTDSVDMAREYSKMSICGDISTREKQLKIETSLGDVFAIDMNESTKNSYHIFAGNIGSESWSMTYTLKVSPQRSQKPSLLTVTSGRQEAKASYRCLAPAPLYF